MESYENLKKELIKQKEVIEKKSGVVHLANMNPSPTEITAGIETIPFNDLSDATATEEDVAYGKTFYAGTAVLKTGTGLLDPQIVHVLVDYKENEYYYEDEIYLQIQPGVKRIRPYQFNQNLHHVHISFCGDIEEIEGYAFYMAKNFVFENFNSLEHLVSVGNNSFAYSGAQGIDIGHIPDTVDTISQYAFYNCARDYMDFKFPDSLKFLGRFAYTCEKRVLANSLDLTNYKLSTLTADTFYNIAFLCDLIIPLPCTSIDTYFDYGGCFRNITIHSNFTNLGSYCFGGHISNPNSNYFLETVTFEGETPPTIGQMVFAQQNINNGFKIYVPDNAIEAYKAVANLSPYINCIYPMSEKE